MYRFRIRFATGCEITVKADTEEDAYKIAKTIDKHMILDIWLD